MANDSIRETTAQVPITVAIRNLEGNLLRLRQGEITNDEFRPKRTVMGVYGQRQPEEYMVRVRIPYGGLTSNQLRTLAQMSLEYGNGTGHVTTRQNMQLHWLRLEHIPEILWKLAETGLTTLQSGGNSVRTVAACPLAGVCSREAFDVTPYAKAVDDYYLGKDDVMSLPRKFKVAFSGCASDCAYSRIQDFGLIAQMRGQNGTAQRGFQVFIGGGLGVFPRLSQPLTDFLPEEELLPTCDALVRVFSRLGDRQNKQKARLKFVLLRLGIDELRRLVKKERDALQLKGSRYAMLIPAENALPKPPAQRKGRIAASQQRDYSRWLRWNVTEQHQDGYKTVLIPLRLGDITSDQMEVVAELADRHADGRLRTSNQQNLVLRNVSQSALSAVYRGLHAAGLTDVRAAGIADVTSCPGTSACSLAITASKGMAKQLAQILEDVHYQEDEALGSLRVKVSACPDSCGQHYLADIGLYGSALHDGSDRFYPAYQLLLGGEVTEKGTRLARPIIRLPARKVPQAVAKLLEFYKSKRNPNEKFSAFVDRTEIETFKQLLEEFTRVRPAEENPSDFIDWDSTKMYILERGEGECSV